MFEKVEVLTRIFGWDDRFFSMEQGNWSQQRCANHILLRWAELLNYLEEKSEFEAPRLPEWVGSWIHSEPQRPWSTEMS